MNLDPWWIVGFVDGEGCFFVGINDMPSLKIRKQIVPEFVVVQHKTNTNLLHALKAQFKCGVVRINHGDCMAYRVRGHDNLLENIVPFFEKHKLKTKKRIDFEKFRDVVLLMDKKAHLTPDGLAKIQKIANQINTKAIQIRTPSSVTEPKIESSFN